jgi:hypothetical protein
MIKNALALIAFLGVLAGGVWWFAAPEDDYLIQNRVRAALLMGASGLYLLTYIASQVLMALVKPKA